jgi:hypothetical protein
MMMTRRLVARDGTRVETASPAPGLDRSETIEFTDANNLSGVCADRIRIEPG